MRDAFCQVRLLLLAVLCLHLGLRLLPAPVLWGDENHYLAFALVDDVQGTRGLLPGDLRFDHRPELASRVFAQVARPHGGPAIADEAAAVAVVEELLATRGDQAFRSVEWLQIALALGLVLLQFLLGRELGLSPRGALLAAALTGLFPPLAFHAHGLWPELLHANLVAFAFLALLRAREARPFDRWGVRCVAWLVAGGLALGYALLAKGTLVPLVPVLVLWPLVGPPAGTGVGLGVRLARAGVFALATLLVVVPQLLANSAAGHGLRLSANRWWNLELGLTDLGEPDPERLALARADGLPPGLERWLPAQRASLAYVQAAATPAERERLARERTLAYVSERGLPGVAFDQVAKTGRLLARPAWSLDQSLSYRRRWGETRPLLRLALIGLGSITWWALLAGGLLGARSVWRRVAWALPLLLVAYVFGALFLVPVKARFCLPALPFLALLTAAGWEQLRRRSPGARSRVPEDPTPSPR